MVPEIPKNDIFIIKNFLVVVTLMAYGRVGRRHSIFTPPAAVSRRVLGSIPRPLGLVGHSAYSIHSRLARPFFPGSQSFIL